ncbi:MAG: hypothetical protein ACOCXA_04450 [Planctomycetota bacterium]
MIARSILFCFILIVVMTLFSQFLLIGRSLYEQPGSFGDIWIPLGLLFLMSVTILVLSIRYYRSLPRSGETASMDGPAAQTLAFSVIGMWMLATGIGPAIGSSVMIGYQLHEGLLTDVPSIAMEILRSLESLVPVLVGLLLFLGAGRLSRFWHRRFADAEPAATRTATAAPPDDQ